jgi:hypothetical protein
LERRIGGEGRLYALKKDDVVLLVFEEPQNGQARSTMSGKLTAH